MAARRSEVGLALIERARKRRALSNGADGVYYGNLADLLEDTGRSTEWERNERRIELEERRALAGPRRPLRASVAAREEAEDEPPIVEVTRAAAPPAPVLKARVRPIASATSRAAAPKPPVCRWELWRPSSSEGVVGQAGPRGKLLQWLRSARATTGRAAQPLAEASVVMQGPSGVGKTLLAELCIAETGYAIMHYGPDASQPLADFLRRAGPQDCDGKRTCLLIDDLAALLEMKTSEGGARSPVWFPVVCTTDVLPRRRQKEFANVIRLFPPKLKDMRAFMQTRIAPGLGLSAGQQASVLEGARADLRQLCIQSCFLAGSASVRERDMPFSPFEFARATLGGRSLDERRRAVEAPAGLLEVALLHENFNQLEGLDIEDAARFAACVTHWDVTREEHTGQTATAGDVVAKAARVFRRGASIGSGMLREWGGWNLPKQQECKRRELLAAREAAPAGVVPWRLRDLAILAPLAELLQKAPPGSADDANAESESSRAAGLEPLGRRGAPSAARCRRGSGRAPT